MAGRESIVSRPHVENGNLSAERRKREMSFLEAAVSQSRRGTVGGHCHRSGVQDGCAREGEGGEDGGPEGEGAGVLVGIALLPLHIQRLRALQLGLRELFDELFPGGGRGRGKVRDVERAGNKLWLLLSILSWLLIMMMIMIIIVTVIMTMVGFINYKSHLRRKHTHTHPHTRDKAQTKQINTHTNSHTRTHYCDTINKADP